MYTHYRYLIVHTVTGEKRTFVIKKGHSIPLQSGEKVAACIGGCTIKKGDKEA